MKPGAVVRAKIADKWRPGVVVIGQVSSPSGQKFLRVAYGTTQEPAVGTDALCVLAATRDGRALDVTAPTWFLGANVAWVLAADVRPGNGLCPLGLHHRIAILVARHDDAVGRGGG